MNSIGHMSDTIPRKNVERYSDGESLSELEVLEQYKKWVSYLLYRATINIPNVVWSHCKVTQEDLQQEANIALLLCWRTYQKTKAECKFTTFAYLRVRGAIVDALREKFRTREGKKRECITFIDIDNVDLPYEEDIGPSIDLNRAAELLEKWERNFIRLLYVKGMTLKEIGSMGGVTESRACQIHSSILGKLREFMQVA